MAKIDTTTLTVTASTETLLDVARGITGEMSGLVEYVAQQLTNASEPCIAEMFGPAPATDVEGFKGRYIALGVLQHQLINGGAYIDCADMIAARWSDDLEAQMAARRGNAVGSSCEFE